MEGYWEDRALRPDGTWELVGSGHNLVVNTAASVLAALCKRDPAYDGLLYWAVGDGATGSSGPWDAGVAAGTIVPVVTDTALRNETFRKAITLGDMAFVDQNNVVSATPTNRLRVEVTLLETEPSAVATVTLREFGLFGGDATGAAGSGLLFNHKLHLSYDKSQFSQLKRTLYLTF